MDNPLARPGTEFNPIVYRMPQDYLYTPTYDWRGPVEFDVFWLVFPTFVTFTAGLNIVQTVQVPNEADFECRSILYHVDAALAQLTQATAIIPNITILLTDGGTSRQLMNAAVPLASVASAESTFPARELPWPKMFQRNSTITASLTNFDVAATTNNVRLTLCGRKIWNR